MVYQRQYARYFVIREPDGIEHGRIKGRVPSHAACKIAVRSNALKDSPVRITIRETGTTRLYSYDIWKEPTKRRKVKTPWMRKNVQLYDGHARRVSYGRDCLP
jgi:hypothetical protein